MIRTESHEIQTEPESNSLKIQQLNVEDNPLKVNQSMCK